MTTGKIYTESGKHFDQSPRFKEILFCFLNLPLFFLIETLIYLLVIVIFWYSMYTFLPFLITDIDSGWNIYFHLCVFVSFHQLPSHILCTFTPLYSEFGKAWVTFNHFSCHPASWSQCINTWPMEKLSGSSRTCSCRGRNIHNPGPPSELGLKLRFSWKISLGLCTVCFSVCPWVAASSFQHFSSSAIWRGKTKIH